MEHCSFDILLLVLIYTNTNFSSYANYNATPRFEKDGSPFHISDAPQFNNGRNQSSGEEEDEEIKPSSRFKYAIVKDLKDTENYYRFIQNWKPYLSKIQKDKDWFQRPKYLKLVKSLQNKINKHINFSFDEMVQTLDETKKIIILEIENSICFVSNRILPDWEEPQIVINNTGSKKQKYKDKSSSYVYVRRFGLEFLDFLWKSYDVILYTNLDQEIATIIIESFTKIKPNIEFKVLICGMSFCKWVYKQSRPVKSLDKIISPENKDRFLILDSESISYLENYEDILIPMLPILISDKDLNTYVPKTSADSKPKVRKILK